MIFTSLFFFKLSEYLGTKKSIWILAIPHLICWIIVLFAVSKWDFYASRFIAGIGDTIFFCAGPPYIGEITTPKVRGYCGFIPVMATFFGSLLITVLGRFLLLKIGRFKWTIQKQAQFRLPGLVASTGIVLLAVKLRDFARKLNLTDNCFLFMARNPRKIVYITNYFHFCLQKGRFGLILRALKMFSLQQRLQGEL